MRAAICGMIAPGDARLAAELAWRDGCISHVNNGILGEIFNAVMVSLAYVETDIRTVLEKAMSIIPKDSEYFHVIDFAYKLSLIHISMGPLTNIAIFLRANPDLIEKIDKISLMGGTTLIGRCV